MFPLCLSHLQCWDVKQNYNHDTRLFSWSSLSRKDDGEKTRRTSIYSHSLKDTHNTLCCLANLQITPWPGQDQSSCVITLLKAAVYAPLQCGAVSSVGAFRRWVHDIWEMTGNQIYTVVASTFPQQQCYEPMWQPFICRFSTMHKGFPQSF